MVLKTARSTSPAAEDSADEVYHPTPASSETSSAPAMGEHCTNNPPLDTSETPYGEIVKLDDVEAYISKPADTSDSTSLLVLLTNGVGVHSPNNQIQADHFARGGYFVVMPDLFNGDPAPASANAPIPVEENPTLLDTVKLKAVEGIKGFMIDMWLARHTPENTTPIIERVLKAAKQEYAERNYTASLGTYVVGYCFGGKYALRLAAKEEVVAVAVAHGSLICKEDFDFVKRPVTLACVENDLLFPDEVREEGQKVLEESHIEYELKVYRNVPHGFGVYGCYPDRHIRNSQNEVFEQFAQFLGRH